MAGWLFGSGDAQRQAGPSPQELEKASRDLRPPGGIDPAVEKAARAIQEARHAEGRPSPLEQHRRGVSELLRAKDDEIRALQQELLKARQATLGVQLAVLGRTSGELPERQRRGLRLALEKTAAWCPFTFDQMLSQELEGQDLLDALAWLRDRGLRAP